MTHNSSKDQSKGPGFGQKEFKPYIRGTNYFLGIAIDKYKTRPLKYCVSDVKGIRDELVRRYDFELENTKMLVDKKATTRNILKALDELFEQVKTQEDSSVVIMFSGHGENLEYRNIGMFIPVNAKDEYEYLDLSIIKNRLDSFKCKHVFVIFDTCFSGLLITQKGGFGRASNIPDNFPSRFALTSGRNSPVQDDSRFATALLSQLRENTDRLSSITLSQAVVEYFVETGTDKDQLPLFGLINPGIDFRGQYYFYPKNYDLSLELEHKKRLEAEDARKEAEEARKTAESALNEVKKQRTIAEQLVLTAYANDLAFKSKIALRDGDRTLALRLALFAIQLVNPGNMKAREAFFEAFYHNEQPNELPLPWNLKTIELDDSKNAEIKYSNDGKYLGIATNKNQAILLDPATFKIQKISAHHDTKVACLAFSPDGQSLALGVNGPHRCAVELWGIQTLKPVARLEGHTDYIGSVQFSPDGKMLASGSKDKTTRIWDVASLECLQTIAVQTAEVSAALFSPDGQNLTMTSYDGSILTWNIAAKQALFSLENAHAYSITYAAVSPDGSILATASLDKTIALWDAQSGKKMQVLDDHTKPVLSVCFSPDGKKIASSSSEDAVLIWDLGTNGIYSLQTKLCGHGGTINSCAFALDGTIATGASDSAIKLWNLQLNGESTNLSTNTRGIRCLVHFPNGQLLATGHDDKSIRIWDIEKKAVLKKLVHHEDSIREIAISPDGKKMVVASSDRNISVWNTRDWQLTHNLQAHTSIVRTVCFAADGNTFASASADQTVKIWQVENDTPLLEFGGLGASIFSLAFTKDGQQLLCGDELGNIILVDIKTQKIIHKKKVHNNIIRCISLAPDGNTFACSSDDRTASICQADTGKILFRLTGFSGEVLCHAFTPMARMLITGDSEGFFSLWSPQTGKQIATVKGHGGAISDLSFSPQNSTLITGSKDKNITIWNLSTEKCWQQLFNRHPVSVVPLSKLQQLELHQLLDLAVQNEEVLTKAHEIRQIAAFADLYAQQCLQSGTHNQEEFNRAVRLYEACLLQMPEESSFEEKLQALREAWKAKIRDLVPE